MRIGILTTNSLRRRHLVRALGGEGDDIRVFVETREPKPPFETAHAFEDDARRHESEIWFGGNPPKFADIAEIAYFQSLNQPEAIAALGEFRPDVAIIYGAGRLSGEVIAQCSGATLNLHGGDPEQYRGLDVALWAIYHGEFGALSATLQRTAAELDSGEIVATAPVAVTPGMPLHQLRRAGAEAAVALVRGALHGFAASGAFTSQPQRRKGRYYSFMPAVLKDICVVRFERHTATLGRASPGGATP